MNKLTVTAFRIPQSPTVSPEHFHHVPNLHNHQSISRGALVLTGLGTNGTRNTGGQEIGPVPSKVPPQAAACASRWYDVSRNSIFRSLLRLVVTLIETVSRGDGLPRVASR